MRHALKNSVFLLLVLACVLAALALFLPAFNETKPAPAVVATSVEQSAAPLKIPVAASGEWNTYHGDQALTGVAEASFSESLDVVWTVATGAPVEQPPVISGGRIFIVTTKPEVLAFDVEGQALWRREIIQDVSTEALLDTIYVDAPLAVFEDRLFIGTDTGLVLALQAHTGEDLWRVQLDSPIHGSPNYSEETGTLYILEQDTGAVVGLDGKTGVKRWRSETVDRADGSPAVGEGLVVYGSCASALHLLAADSGAKKHDVSIEGGGGQVAGGAALVDAFAYAGCRDGRVMRADLKNATFNWIKSVSVSEVFSTPAVKGDWVIVAALDGVVHALDRDTGDRRWEQGVGGEPGSPVIAGDKVLVSSDDTLFLLNLQEGRRLWDMQMAGFITSPAVITNLVVVGCEDGTLIAFRSL